MILVGLMKIVCISIYICCGFCKRRHFLIWFVLGWVHFIVLVLRNDLSQYFTFLYWIVFSCYHFILFLWSFIALEFFVLLTTLFPCFVIFFLICVVRGDFLMPLWAFHPTTQIVRHQWNLPLRYGIPMVSFTHFYLAFFNAWNINMFKLQFIRMGEFAYQFFTLLVTIRMGTSLQVSAGHLFIQYVQKRGINLIN